MQTNYYKNVRTKTSVKILLVIKSFLILLMIPLFMTSSCGQTDNRPAIEKWGTRTDFSKNIQLFLIRPSSIAYSFSTSMITTIIERQKQLGESANIIQFIDQNVWDYKTKQPTSDSFKYHFESYYENCNDLLLPDTNWNNGINIGLVSDIHDVSSSAESKQMDVEQISTDDFKFFDESVRSKTNSSKKYDLYIDDLLLMKMYANRRMYLYALLCRVDHIYVLPQGLITNSASIFYQYYKYYELDQHQQLSQTKKRQQWNDIFQLTSIFSSNFYNNFTMKFSGTERAREYSDLSVFLNYYEKITIFNFETGILDSYKIIERNRLTINNIYLEILDFPKYFNLPQNQFIKTFSKIYFNSDTVDSISDCFFNEDSKNKYDKTKQNVIFLLGKEWSSTYIKNNTSSQTEATEIINIFKKMMQKYQTMFDPEKYNYIFKGHPRQGTTDLIASTTEFCSFTDSKIVPIFFDSTIPMELIVNVDFINHNTDKKYELFDPSNYVDVDPSYKNCKSLYAGYYIHSTAIYTTMTFISQKINSPDWTNIYKKIIPPEIDFLMDDFRTDGINKSSGVESIYKKTESYQINLKFFQSAFENLMAINHFPDILSFSKFSDWVEKES